MLPPDLREWLPEDHFAWFLLAALSRWISHIYAVYRLDGHGRPAHEPGMMVALLLYAYAHGERSSRAIERACVEDVAYRVIAANQRPDHTTVAHFRKNHERALAGLFSDVLSLCADAGLVSVGVVAVDGTKLHANAAQQVNRDYEQIAEEILAEADAVDRAEDGRYGDARGDELPPELSTHHGGAPGSREAKRRLDQKRAEEARAIPRSRRERLAESKRRLEEDHRVECEANAACEAYRARGVMKDGRRFGGPPKPFEPPEKPAGKINTTDLDSRNVKTRGGYLQGYNAQAATNERQIVIAAEVTNASPDFGQLEPIVSAAQSELKRAGITDTPQVLVADAGYWHQEQMEQVVERGIQVLIPPDAGKRKSPRPGWDGGLYAFMRRVLDERSPPCDHQLTRDLEAAGVGAPTVRKALGLLQGMLQRAVEWERIDANRVRAVRKPALNRDQTVRALTPKRRLSDSR